MCKPCLMFELIQKDTGKPLQQLVKNSETQQARWLASFVLYYMDFNRKLLCQKHNIGSPRSCQYSQADVASILGFESDRSAWSAIKYVENTRVLLAIAEQYITRLDYYELRNVG